MNSSRELQVPLLAVAIILATVDTNHIPGLTMTTEQLCDIVNDENMNSSSQLQPSSDEVQPSFDQLWIRNILQKVLGIEIQSSLQVGISIRIHSQETISPVFLRKYSLRNIPLYPSPAFYQVISSVGTIIISVKEARKIFIQSLKLSFKLIMNQQDFFPVSTAMNIQYSIYRLFKGLVLTNHMEALYNTHPFRLKNFRPIPAQWHWRYHLKEIFWTNSKNTYNLCVYYPIFRYCNTFFNCLQIYFLCCELTK